MARLTRAQQQERTRAAVLAAAEREFGEHGYAEAKVDRIAERADLTRGAVYSNFPSKRALYLAVLLNLVEARWAGQPPPAGAPESAEQAVGAFARAWLERLPLTERQAGAGRLELRSLTGAVDDAVRAVLAQVTRLEALLLALALESYAPAGSRQVRTAELVLTMLQGSAHLAENAPGFGDPFDVASACERLAEAGLPDTWDPPHLSHVRPARPCRDSWTPTEAGPDLVGGEAALGEDGVIVFLGVGRLEAAEEAVRAAAPGEPVTVVVQTSDPDETGRLVRLRIRDTAGCLRTVFPADRLPRLHVVLDGDGRIGRAFRAFDAETEGDGLEGAKVQGFDTGAAGLVGVQPDVAEAAVRVSNGVIVARARGRGAGHAAASARGHARTAGDGSRRRGHGAP